MGIQLKRYIITGLLGTGIHLSVLFFVVEVLKADVVFGATLGFFSALVTSYVLNYRWTFKAGICHKQAFLRYVFLCISGLGVNVFLVTFIVCWLGWWYMAAQLSVIFVVPLINFFINRSWTFASNEGSYDL